MLDPLHQFVIKPILNIKIAGIDLSFTNSSFAVLVAVVMIYLLFSIGIRSKKLIPDRLQAVGEICYYLVAGLINDNVGPRGQKYFSFVFSIFFFVLFGNLVGMIPYMFTFTSHIIVTFTLAMIVFLFVTVLGFVRHGMKFFGILTPKGLPNFLLPLLVPIELISYLSRPISLSVRLFANMMAGHTMMKVFAGFAVMLGVFGVAPILVNTVLTGFEIAISILQAYIFTILTCVYLNDAIHLH
ncbi:MAG: F0F1 ATP synthase subunit A [Holosporaceae bacterium]|nr:F0F1 ATP synthase subunit A [Holosporaceae bacterium]